MIPGFGVSFGYVDLERLLKTMFFRNPRTSLLRLHEQFFCADSNVHYVEKFCHIHHNYIFLILHELLQRVVVIYFLLGMLCRIDCRKIYFFHEC